MSESNFGTVIDSTPAETVKQSNVVVNPILSAIGVLLGFAGGFLVKQGLITQSELAVLVPALMTLGVAGWRMWVAHHNADKANRIAANPANKAVSLR